MPTPAANWLRDDGALEAVANGCRGDDDMARTRRAERIAVGARNACNAWRPVAVHEVYSNSTREEVSATRLSINLIARLFVCRTVIHYTNTRTLSNLTTVGQREITRYVADAPWGEQAGQRKVC
jgi:hypothetical protein